MATLNWTHVGQYRPYGDTYRVCEVRTDEQLSDSDVLNLVGEHHKRPKAEFDKGCSSPMEYFAGWYTVEHTEYGYLYTGCEPYTD
jgi:hypothetical protein